MKKYLNVMDKITGWPILKRRALYIVGIVIFTILFLLMLFLCLLLPMVMRMMGSGDLGNTAVTEDVELDDDTEWTDDTEWPDDTELTGDREWPDDTELTGDMEWSDDTEWTDDTEWADDTGDSYAFTQEDQDVFRIGLRVVRRLAVLFGVLDAVCIYMLVYLRRKKKRLALEEEKEKLRQAAESGEAYLDSTEEPKKPHPYRNWIILLIIVVLVIVLLRVLSGRDRAEESQTQATIHSGEAEIGDLVTVLPGAGTLAEEDAESFSLPEDVEIKRWLVSNGDAVEEGQMLATVDPVSVMTSIVEVQDKMDSLDEGLAEYEDQTATSTITAAADGRVIKIYASDGTAVTDTMYEHSALMQLSLDGLMSVTLDTDANLSVGDTVTVTLSNSTEMEGKVDSVTNQTAVFTISDDGPTLGDTVSVKTKSGTTIGEGTLCIHSEWDVTGFVGVVSGISVSEGSKVNSGDTLLTLTDTEDTGAYELLLEQREKLEDQIETLFKAYEDGYVCAPCDGVITNIDKDAATGNGTEDTAGSENKTDTENTTDPENTAEPTIARSGAVTATSMVSQNTMVKVVQVDDSDPEPDEDWKQKYEELEGEYGQLQDDYGQLQNEYDDLQEDNNNLKEDNNNLKEDYNQLQQDYDKLKGESAGSVRYAVGTVQSVSGNSVTISYIIGGSGSSTVTLPANIGLYKDGKYSSNASAGQIKAGDLLIIIYNGENGDVQTAICASGSLEEQQNGGGTAEENPDLSLGAGELEDLYGDLGDLDDYDIDMDDLYGDLDLDMDDLYGDYDLGDLDTEDLEADAIVTAVEETYGVAERTLASIIPQDHMKFTITVDETDIAKLSKDQEALVTLDAFPGQSFVGSVSAIHRSGSNSGGRTKYTADITIDREEGMLAGMNASAQITLDTENDVLCIPEAALVEENGVTYVYTTYDESDDELGGLTEVTTGKSDGANVEILSGLEEGGEYYYRYLDVVNYESASAASDSGMF